MMPEKGTDKPVFAAFEKALKSAKRKAEIAQSAEDFVFRLLEDMRIDAELVHSNAENAENLKDAITCYLSYDEYSLAGIMREVRTAYNPENE